mmetsp:Transcript_96334/g.276605  ORF Transcript_96334/g.276605 Transcript_96334/m.276605 type:complete len:205 (+) Transcript_96334:669-1283(+)
MTYHSHGRGPRCRRKAAVCSLRQRPVGGWQIRCRGGGPALDQQRVLDPIALQGRTDIARQRGEGGGQGSTKERGGDVHPMVVQRGLAMVHSGHQDGPKSHGWIQATPGDGPRCDGCCRDRGADRKAEVGVVRKRHSKHHVAICCGVDDLNSRRLQSRVEGCRLQKQLVAEHHKVQRGGADAPSGLRGDVARQVARRDAADEEDC